MIRLVAIDLDGTLLRTDGTVPASAREAVRAAEQAGLRVVLVTGRPPRAVRAVVEALGIRDPVICLNGALIYDFERDQVLHHVDLPPEVSRRVIEGLRARVPGVVFGCEVRARLHRERAWRTDFADPEEVVCESAAALARGPVSKLLAYHPEVPYAELAALAEELAGGDAVLADSGSHLVQLSASGADKASALERLCGQLGVRREEVAAVGDMPNDLPMLAWAGLAVAVRNAHPQVLAAADEVTGGNDEDGVVQVLERLTAEARGRRA